MSGPARKKSGPWLPLIVQRSFGKMRNTRASAEEEEEEEDDDDDKATSVVGPIAPPPR